MTELSDDLLVAYVDGQLARDQSEAIERVLDNDQVAARRVEALKDAHRQLEAAFEAMLAGQLCELEETLPPAEEPAEAVESESPAEIGEASLLDTIARLGPVPLLGAAATLVLVGAIAGYALRGGDAPVAAPLEAQAQAGTGWQDDVARAHALFGRESFEVGFESQGNLDLVRFQLAKTIGSSLVVPDLSGEGLTFKRAQILRRAGKPIAQIAYLSAAGTPVALYAAAGEEPAAMPAGKTVGGVRAATFATGGISYLLAGRLPEDAFGNALWAAKREIIRN